MGSRRWLWVCKELPCGGMNGGGKGGWTEFQLGKMIPFTTRTVCIYINFAATSANIHLVGNSFTWRFDVSNTCCSSRLPRPSPRNLRGLPIRLQPNAAVVRLVCCHAPPMHSRWLACCIVRLALLIHHRSSMPAVTHHGCIPIRRPACFIRHLPTRIVASYMFLVAWIS